MPRTSTIALAAALVAFSATLTGAGEYDNIPETVTDEITKEECGACHMVFPPNRLTVGGWKKIMATLSDHFGEDASLNEKTVRHIEAYMTSKAFDAKDTVPSKMVLKQWAKRGLVDPIRITETPNWARHHGTQKYKRMSKAIGYARGSNCIVCHKNAEKGMYEEFPGMYGGD